MSSLDLLSDAVSLPQRKNNPRDPSPSPSSSSASSCDSKEGDIFTGKHFDPDVVSCGSLGMGVVEMLNKTVMSQ